MDDLLGCFKWKNRYYFCMSDITLWILNYAKYDPGSLNRNYDSFKNGIYNIADDSREAYLEYARQDEVSFDDLAQFQAKSDDNEKITFYFFVDFDNNTMVSSFPDISIEEYVPDHWQGVYDNPVPALPKDLQTPFWWCY